MKDSYKLSNGMTMDVYYYDEDEEVEGNNVLISEQQVSKMTEQEYKKNLMMMFDSLRTEHKGVESCKGVICDECPLNECCYGLGNFHIYETIKKVEQWKKQHPIKEEK